MAIGCGAKFAKLVLFTFNVICWALALAVLSCGLIWLLNSDFVVLHHEINAPTFRVVTWLFIIVGAVLVVFTFSGCCGAVKENECLLIMYTGFLCLVLILGLVATVYSYKQKDTVITEYQKIFNSSIYKYPSSSEFNDTSTGLIKFLIDDMQSKFLHCCGYNNKSDWMATPFYTNQTGLAKKSVPPSCCRDMSNLKNVSEVEYNQCLSNTTAIYEKGCKESIHEWIYKNCHLVVGISLTVSVVMALGIFFSVCLIASIRRQAMLESLRR